MIRLFSKRRLVLATAFLALGLLAGCGGGAPITSWPGMVVTDSTAYLASSDQLYALDLSPDIADSLRPKGGWPYQPTSTAGIGYHSQPALSADGTMLYVGSDSATGNAGQIFAISVETKTFGLKWTFPPTETQQGPGNIFGGVVVVSDTVYFAGGLGGVYALDAATGTPSWTQPFDTGARIWSLPAVGNGLVFVASQDHHVYAIKAADGTLAWKYPGASDPEVGTLAGSPSVFNGTVYVGSFDGNLYAIDLSGKLKWTFKTDGRLWDPPVEVDGTLYFGDLNGNVYAIDAQTQQLKWPQVATVEGGVRATPLVANGIVYVGTDQFKMYALEADTGRPHWQSPFTGQDGEMFLVTPAISGDTLIALPNLAGSSPVRLYGLNKDSGAMLWRYPPAPAK